MVGTKTDLNVQGYITYLNTLFREDIFLAFPNPIIYKNNMLQNIFRKLPLVMVLSSSLFLSGCISTKQIEQVHEFQGIVEQPEPNEMDSPDMQLNSDEVEQHLAQELAILKETGKWGIKVGGHTEVESNTGPFDFPIVINNQVQAYLDLFKNKQHRYFKRWLARSGKYIALMEKELERAGLPRDLAYLAMIESGYDQRAYSHAGAVGLWQFMRATGKQYNLEINKYVDERRNAEKSTVAAVNFLADLYDDFGDWYLAVAAYNAGPGKITKGMKRYKVDNFWDLAEHDFLKLETKRYVPKLIAAIILAREPEKHGFKDIPYESPLAYDTIRVDPGMSLDAIAIMSGSASKTIKQLNLELRKGRTPENVASYNVKIPAGTKEVAQKNRKRLHSYVSTGFKTHKIGKNDSIASICRKYDINTTTLLKVNNLRSSRLKRGTNLRIPYSLVKYQLLPEGGINKPGSHRDNLILHRIKPGDTLSGIAKKYHVPRSMIMSWNGLKNAHTIRAGQQLALFIEGAEKTKKPGSAIFASTTKRLINDSVKNETVNEVSDNSVVVLSGFKKSAPTEDAVSLAQQDYSWYKVQNGDSLWTISRRFNMSASDIRKLNNLKSNLIRPGSKLKIKKV